MKFWNDHDLEIIDLRENIIDLTEEFEKKFGEDIENYNKKLDFYLKRRLKKQSNLILKTSVLMTTSSLVIQNRNI